MNEARIYPLTKTPPRMRTAAGAIEIIKAADPETAVTLKLIQRLIKTGAVPHVPVGRKKLVNVDKLMEYLSRGSGEGMAFRAAAPGSLPTCSSGAGAGR